MAITESLPVGNEVAGGAASKASAGADAGVFAQSFAAAGGAEKPRTGGSGTLGSGAATVEGSGLVVPAKGQQDLAEWGAGHEFQGQDGPAAGQTGSGNDAGQGSGAVSSLIGQHEVVELPGAAAESFVADPTVSGVGTKELALTPQTSEPAGDTGQGGVSGSGDLRGNHLATSVTGDQAVKVVQVAGNPAQAPIKLPSAPVFQGDGLVKAGVGNSGSVASPGSQLLQPVAVKASASLSTVAETIGQAGALTAGTNELEAAGRAVTPGAVQDAAQRGKTGSVPNQPVIVASVRDGSAVGKTLAKGFANQQVGRDGPGTANVATAHGRDAAKTSGSVAGPRKKTSLDDKTIDVAGTGSGFARGTLTAAEVALEQGAGAGKATESAALSVATPAAVRPASEARPLVFEEIGSEAMVSSGQALADSAAAKVAGRQGLDPSAPVVAVDGPGRPGSVAVTGAPVAVTGTTGRRGNGSLPKPDGQSAVSLGSALSAAAVPSAGDGSSVLPVSVGTTVLAPLASGASAAPETGVGVVSEIASRGVENAVGTKPGAVGPALVKDKDRKTVVDGGRSEAAAGTAQGVRPRVDEKVAAGALQEAATAPSTGKAETAHGKSLDAGQAVIGAGGVGATGAAVTVSGNAHGSAAGLSGGLTAAASPAPVRAEVVSGAGGSSGRPAGSSEDGGLVGLSSGTAGSGQGHTTLQATPTVLEVGVPGGTHGWLKIRAELGEGGAVQASVSSATQAGQETLRRELPAMSAYLQSEHVPVTLQMAHGVAAAAGSGASGLAGGDGLSSGLGFGGGGGQAGSNAEQSRSEAGGLAGASAGGADAGELGRERTQSADTGVAGAVSGPGAVADGVSAAVASAEAEWARPLGYGGVSVRGGGSWVNVIA